MLTTVYIGEGGSDAVTSEVLLLFSPNPRHTDKLEETPTSSFNEERSVRQAKRQKLAREEAQYGSAPTNLNYESMLEVRLYNELG